MGQALLTFLGVILGAAIAGTISLWQVQLVTKREREVRQTLRQQERVDRSDAFQRESILALQDALVDLVRACTRKREAEYDEARWAVSKFQARIFDTTLRNQAAEVKAAARNMILAEGPEATNACIQRANKAMDVLDERVTFLLLDHF